MRISNGNLIIEKIEESYHIILDEHLYEADLNHPSAIKVGEDIIPFNSPKYTRIINYKDHEAIETYYENMADTNLCLKTLVYIGDDNKVEFSFNVLKDDERVSEILFPNSFKNLSRDGYTYLPYGQGLYIPNEYDYEYNNLHFDGQFGSSAAYMAMYGQYDDGYGYLTIVNTYWDTKYVIYHESTKLGTGIQLRHLPSLGKYAYLRKATYYFEKNLDFNRGAKIYREYVKEKGIYKSLKEKRALLPNIDKLIGASLIHFGIKTHISEDSRFYDKDDMSKNDKLVTFKERLNEIKKIKSNYDIKLACHLDGWAYKGYDNGHPDVLPVNEEAGGMSDLCLLAEEFAKNDEIFILHDQYRDYYLDSDGYSANNALVLKDGRFFEQSIWAGGRQNYLCASLAKDYVKRNVDTLLKEDIKISGYYLDVFTCNELDECYSNRHPMSRKECAEYRKDCLRYLLTKNILTSSEEVSDWSNEVLVFAHYAPYEFMLKDKDAKRMGKPIPLFNLVYHDSLIIPWMMEIYDEDYMLYALLNGGIPYLIREGAYPNTDGFFKSKEISFDEKVKRAKIVAGLHTKLAYREMLSFTFLDDGGQSATYEGGITINIWPKLNKYEIIEE